MESPRDGAQIITVLTALLPSKADHLMECYRGLVDQKLPSGWTWEWLIQEDAEKSALRDFGDPRVRIAANGRSAGAGGTRNLALVRARGDYVRVLDADDILPVGALHRDIVTLEGHPRIAWTASRVLDLLPGGAMVGFDNDPPEGYVERGAVLAHWLSHEYRAQVHPATLCVRRQALWAVGGWMGLPASEDTGLLLALNALWPGWFDAEPGLVYRKWDGQTTAEPTYLEAEFRRARYAAVEARALAAAELLSATNDPR